MPVAEHHRAEHDVFGQFLGFRFHHHHGVVRAGDDEIELGFLHLVERRVEHVFVIDEADAGAADRAHERRAGNRQRGGGGDHRQDVGIVLLIVRQHGDDHLRVAAPAVGEQRTDRAVDQARGQRVLFGRPAFALEEAAGNAAGGVIFFLVVDGERKEIDAFLRLLGGHDGGEHGGLAVGGEHGAVGLARDAAGLEGELAPAPVEFNSMNVEHCVFLSWFFRPVPKAMSKTARGCRARPANCGMQQRLAILPWLFRTLPWRKSRPCRPLPSRRQRLSPPDQISE